MITRFMTVYPGHIDMPDLGQDATPANERNYSNEQLVSVFNKLEAAAVPHDRVERREEAHVTSRLAWRAHPHAGGIT